MIDFRISVIIQIIAWQSRFPFWHLNNEYWASLAHKISHLLLETSDCVWMWAKTDPQNFVIRRDLVSVSPVCELGYRSSPESRIRLPSGPQQVVAKWAPESRSSGLLTSILGTVPLCFLPPFLLPVSIRTQPSRAKPSLGSASNSYFSHLPVPTEGSKGQLLKRCSLHLFTWL